jgi:serine/threonine protein kinase/tetratricopeptide (TPR) repeat protein
MSDSEIFRAVIKLPVGERKAYLDQACGDNAALRHEVESLLQAHEAEGSFLARLDTAPNLPGSLASFRERPGSVIGPYKLLQQIGEGGMGTVFLAEQSQPVQRKVALKIIKPGMDSRQVIARFEAERQALALMDHPNIAKVLDAGTTEGGWPYFVMELVKGVPITTYCDDHRLTCKERLNLFVPVCQAIQHAHQKGIIHRDLKPSNVMICLYDGVPVPKVIDFGVAKAAGPRLTDKTLFTELGQVVGTLEYMSPEQAELNQLDVDTRSDIYSLGVLLYELLTGTTPLERKRFQAVAFLEVLRLIREEEPQTPSTRLSTTEALPSIAANRGLEPKKLSGLVRGDLDWIAMKCLEKNRNRRYETANSLVEDLQRYLSNEPVLAYPPSASYRMRKFIARNKLPVGAASAIVLCLVTGTIGASAGLYWVTRERDAKSKALVAETKARAAEKQARERALAALRAMTDDFVENQMARGANLTPENKEFLRKIIKHFEGFASITADDFDSRAIRAEGYYRVGHMRYRLGEPKEAEAAYREAIAGFGKLMGEFPTSAVVRIGLAKAQNNMGLLLSAAGRLKDAEAAYTAALAHFKRLSGDFPKRPEYRLDQSRCQINLGNVYQKLSRTNDAEAAYVAALALQKQLSADIPDRPEFRLELARSHNNLGVLFRDMGRLKETEREYARALDLYKRLAAEFPTRADFRQDLARSQNNWGNLLRETGRMKDSETAFASALALRKQLAAEFPTRPELRHELARTHSNLGEVLAQTGRLEEAEAGFSAALTLQTQLAADFPARAEYREQLAITHYNLGLIFGDTGRRDEGETALLAALALRKQLAASSPKRPEFRFELAESQYALGVLLRDSERRADAERVLTESLALTKQLVAEFPARPQFRAALARSHSELGKVFRDAGSLKQAEMAYDSAFALRTQVAAEFPKRPSIREDVAHSYFDRAVLLGDIGKFEQAEQAFGSALAIRRQLAAESPNQPDLRHDLASALVSLARVQLKERKFQAALLNIDEAVPHHQAALTARPRRANYRERYRGNLATRVQANAGLGDRTAAKLAAEKLRDLGWNPIADAYDAARSLALCVPITEERDGATEADRQAPAAFYGDEAMTMLRDAVAKGFKDATHIKQNHDLDPLRQREDFHKLLADIQATTD